MEFVTGTGQRLFGVHEPGPECEEGCCIHSPSDHPMRTMPLYWREDLAVMERICPHGVGHPDPDHLAYVARNRGRGEAAATALHGCCGLGCCSGQRPASVLP